MKNIAILGSTGSIGIQTLNIIRRNRDKFKCVALVANCNAKLIAEQAKEFGAEYVGLSCENAYNEIKSLLPDNIKLVVGRNALVEAVRLKNVDTVLAAVVGMSGLESAIEAVRNKKDVALANKESLVAGGELLMNEVKKNNVKLLPVDSEHSAVWQCLEGQNKNTLSRIILTASGGAFYDLSYNELENISPIQATVHPNWKMGKKITVDSSTMMNKGLEIIEARWLFDTENIDYIIHKESIIHSMVEFTDGSTIAQLSNPNMEIPISLALSYPERLENDLPKFNFEKNLSFASPKEDVFILPQLAKKALKMGGNAPCILNSCNEAAVSLFLDYKIKFLDIQNIIQKAISNCSIIEKPSLKDIFETHNNWQEILMKDYKRYL